MIYSTDKQYHIGLRHGDCGRYVILPGDPKRCAKIAAYFDDAQLIADSREYVTYTGYIDGEKVSVTSTGIGGPSAAIAVEELVRCGADTFIRVGTCGGMSLEVCGGDLVIATASVRQEGTTREYAPIEFPAAADFEVTTALVQAAKRTGYTYHAGIVQSKDSFYGQHEPEKMPVSHELLHKWEAYSRLGVKASEMESAALFVLGSYLDVRTGTVLLTVGNQNRQDRGLENNICHETEPAILTAIEAIRELIRLDRE